jgi:hypothetical protein
MSTTGKAAVWVIGLILSGLIGWSAWQVGQDASERRQAKKERASTLRAEALEREAVANRDLARWSNTLQRVKALR